MVEFITLGFGILEEDEDTVLSWSQGQDIEKRASRKGLDAPVSYHPVLSWFVE